MQIRIKRADWDLHFMRQGLLTCDGKLKLEGFQSMLLRSIRMHQLGNVSMVLNKTGFAVGRDQVACLIPQEPKP